LPSALIWIASLHSALTGGTDAGARIGYFGGAVVVVVGGAVVVVVVVLVVVVVPVVPWWWVEVVVNATLAGELDRPIA